MRSDWVNDEVMGHILAALMPQNALVLRVARVTGLRIGDVLELKTEQVKKGRFTVKEQKTGKSKRVNIPAGLRLEVLARAGRLWAFEHRTDWRKHRTRQAVNKDLARAAKTFRTSGTVGRGVNVTPHTTRKQYAVETMEKTGSLGAVQKKLNHTDPEVTLLYAMADQLTERKGKKRGRKKRA